LRSRSKSLNNYIVKFNEEILIRIDNVKEKESHESTIKALTREVTVLKEEGARN